MRPGRHRSRRADSHPGPRPSDRALLLQARAGRDESFALLYGRYAGRLRGVVRSQASRVLAPRIDPDDIVQEAFLGLFNEAIAGRCDIPEGGDAWGLLVVIALNRVRAVANWHRASRRDVRKTLGGELSDRLVRSIPAPEERPLVELRLLAAELLARFPTDERRIIERRIGGNDIASIAAHAHVSTRTVDRILRRFRAVVRATFAIAPADRDG